MNVRKIRENLGKVRTCIQRRDFPQAVRHVHDALKELGGQQAPMDLRGDFRSSLADICAHADYKKLHSQPRLYQPGKERELYAFFHDFYNQLVGQVDEEDYETTLKRKLNLDRCINNGKSFAAQGKHSDADDCFKEALKFYKDEIGAFAIMAQAMMDQGQYVRALGYVRKGLEFQPNNKALFELGDECNRMRAKTGK